MSHSRKVMVTGCFDMLHSGHVAFLKEAAAFGHVYVCIGNDENVYHLKGRYPVTSQQERKYMIESLSCVTGCRINRGNGLIDFLEELEEIKPDLFIVNEDGASDEKAELCRERNIEYKVLQRLPHEGLPPRSTTRLRTECLIPYRIDLAGGWLDQPFVSAHHPGPVLTISLEPIFDFHHRSGMATSTRNKAIELWRNALPSGDREKLAKILFSYENPPGTKEVAGSQDALGIVLPGLNRLYYNGGYWPEAIEQAQDNDILDWLEAHLFLVPLGPRGSGYAVLEDTQLNADNARRLSEAAESCWKAILEKDAAGFGRFVRESFEAQVALFPNMVTPEILQQIERYAGGVMGWKLSGAGGGGYIIFVSRTPVKDALRIKIRRKGGEW